MEFTSIFLFNLENVFYYVTKCPNLSSDCQHIFAESPQLVEKQTKTFSSDFQLYRQKLKI